MADTNLSQTIDITNEAASYDTNMKYRYYSQLIENTTATAHLCARGWRFSIILRIRNLPRMSKSRCEASEKARIAGDFCE